VLQVENLRTRFVTAGSAGETTVRAVEDVTLSVRRGKVLGLVGESGCGKTVTALSVLKLIPQPPGRIVSGRVLFNGTDLLPLSEKEMQKIRGRRISMIFQDPLTSLNPVFTIGYQVAEMLRVHLGASRAEARDRTIELLRHVGIPSPERRYREYPHQLSGGMRQRVMIAMAVSCSPELVFADEPTTALDVTIQAQILDLLKKLREEMGMAMVLISHDLGIISETADEVAVMYAGRIVEQAPTERLFETPRHPYTKGLLASLPRFDEASSAHRKRLKAITGMVPSLSRLPSGCAFHPRCPLAIERCSTDEPALEEVSPGHRVSCWLEQPSCR
jgi:oligopeptide/dipeptide ABC transporter ATP-binding protein